MVNMNHLSGTFKSLLNIDEACQVEALIVSVL